MATQIGTIKTLIGTVTAKTTEGAQRALQTDDIVYQDDIIITGQFGAVEIELTDGSVIDLGRNSEAALNPDTLYPEGNAAADGDAIQQAILDGADPTQNAEPTAAGNNDTLGGNEGTSIVSVQHLAPETTPESGFDTTGVNFVFSEEIEEIQNFINDSPTVSENALISFDDDVLGGNSGGIGDDSDGANLSGQLAHDYGNEGIGSLLLIATGAPTGFVYNVSAGGTVLTVSQGGTNVFEIALSNTTSGNYTITQLASVIHEPGLDENNQSFNLNYQVTDGNGDSVIGVVIVDIDDDTATAIADTNNITEGATIIVDAASGVLNNDSFGADNPAIATVSGVAAGNNTSTALTTGVATAIAGSYGELTLAADGSYSYEATANGITADMQDVFVYTITDTDGDTSTVTLTIDIANVTLTPNNVTETANEAGLPTGSDAASDSETITGQLAVSGTGVTYTLTSSTIGNNGEITLNNDGSFSYTLSSAVDSVANPGTNTVDGVETFNYTATDTNGNTVTSTITINVIDDVPTVAPNAQIRLDDDALADGNPGGRGDNIDSLNATGTLAHSFGADGEGTLLLSDTGAPAGFVYSLNGDGTVLTISQDGTDVLQVTLSNNTDGQYSVEQLAPVDHRAGGRENNQNFNINYRVTDGDGDVQGGRLRINVDDDTPTVSRNALVRLDDDALADGNPGGRGDNADSQNATGTLAHSFGADGEGTLLLSDTGAPAGFVYSLNGDGTILTISQDGTDVLQVTLSNNTDGQYSVEQLAPVDHRAGGRENNQNFNINYRVTDNDGDVVGGRLRVNVDDDTPTAIADTDNVTEGAALIVDAASGLLSNDNFGADNPAIATVSGVAAGNNTSTALTTGVATAIAGSYGELTLAADGSYSYEATANGITADMQDVFVYTITDTDGDTSTVTLTIDVANTSLVAVNPTVVADEAGLDNLANTSETVTGQLNVTGTGVTYTLTSNTAGNNGDITLNNDGSFSYTLSSAVDSGANPGTNTVNGVETFNYTATDANGNTTTGTISIDVIDDVPTAVIDTGSVTEGATLIVDAASGVLSNDNFGADNPAIANVSGVAAGNNTSTALTTGVATAIAGSYGELTLAADGSYSYEATANGITADMQDVFVYTITDTDGDTSTVTLTIDVANIALVAVNPTVVANETGLPAGNDAASDSETVTGQLTVAGDNVTYSFTPGSNGAGNNGNITLNSDGSFSYTLTSPVDSGANLGTNTVNGVETFNYTATDANGNTVAGTITINVIDDVPTASANALVMLDDDALVDGNPGGSGDNINSQNATGTLAHSFGADGEGTLLLSDTGAPAGFVYSLNGDGTTLTISQDGTDVLQVTLADLTSGDYTVTQLAPINHPEGNDENNQGFNLAYQVTDGDGDTVNGQVNISIDDDSPVVTVNQDVVNDVAYSFTVTNHDEVSSAGYHSSYGYYIKDADGNPTTGTIIWDDVHDNDTAPVSVQGHSPDQIGFFIIPNGDNRNSSLTDDTEVTFQLVNGEWTAFDAGQPLIGNGSPVLFDNAALNKDNEDHVQDNGLIGNQNWEDLPIRTGDADYNDVNVNVDWTSVTASGDAINTVSFGADGAEFGADGPGGIDFTLEEVTILGDLTSNGKDVTFEARDTDSDGYNDLIVGSTEDGDVLTIDGLLDSDDYDLHLFAPVESTNDGADDVQITANLSITDGDGDSAFATLNFNLDINQITEAPAPIDPI